ncbi:MAG: hypothetical protein F6K31_14470 [Symploca sp. SIO2G7]|nr:hypothetical protein [Symploca sp. SIO2G7]
MVQVTHKKVFDLLIEEVLEAYPHVENKLDFVSRDILKHLQSNPSGVQERLKKGSFTKDDGKISQREAFLLNWVDEVWGGENDSQELYDKFLQDLNGTPQEFDVYAKDLPE